MNPKEHLGHYVASLITPGTIIAVGTGSTVDAVIRALGSRIASERIAVAVVPTSWETAELCASIGCTVISPHAVQGHISWGFDGADEIDPSLRLIKGLGGALLREKILALACDTFTILADESKLVTRLGERCPVPIEVIPEARRLVAIALGQLGATEVNLRSALPGKHGPIVTESGNLILDARFHEISDRLPQQIKAITGVVEHGIFENICSHALIVSQNGTIQERRT
jgi:ribose 5-phosphate isomerase A